MIFQHDNINNINSSYDDLPPPPPPLSSSPSPPCPESDSDNSDSVVTAQMPVPQTRSSIRRNEYVNIPVQPQVKHQVNVFTFYYYYKRTTQHFLLKIIISCIEQLMYLQFLVTLSVRQYVRPPPHHMSVSHAFGTFMSVSHTFGTEDILVLFII